MKTLHGIIIVLACLTLVVCGYAADMEAQLDAGGAFRIYDAASNEVVQVSSNNQVGIGKTPGVALDVNGTVRATNFIGSAGGLYNLPKLPPVMNIARVAVNGTPAGPGTEEQPFAQPQQAYNFLAAMYVGQPAAVVIASGSYSGLVMNAGHIHVIGESRPQLAGLTVMMPTMNILGKQRVENLIVTEHSSVIDGGVKMHNVRFEEGVTVLGSDVEFQDCFLTANLLMSNALHVVGGSSNVGVYQSAAEIGTPGVSTVVIDDGVKSLEIIGCELVQKVSGLVIDDRQNLTLDPLHLYSHNYIKGQADVTAIQTTSQSNQVTVAFHQNTVFGNVGQNVTPKREQYHSNNAIYGQKFWRQPATVTSDPFNNSFISTIRNLPDTWND